MSYARDPNGSSYFTETRQYNILQQLTRLTVPGVMDHEYRFSATQNDGRITQRKDWVSGEEITYQYDSLKRLITAQTTGPEWGQSFGYDGFGNLLSQTVTKGSAPSLNVTVDPATNRMTNSGMSYDANGSLTAMPGLTMTYDTDNRMLSNSSGDSYFYDASGQRVMKTNGSTLEYYFYGVEGNLLNNWPNGYNVYFGSKLIYNSGGTVVTDRLGSVVHKEQWTEARYFPYGDEPTTTQQNRPKFATYFRDGTTALDYAQQRYYASTLGRFTSPDRSGKNESLGNPQSFNRYAYVNGDPANFNDPSGDSAITEYCISKGLFGSTDCASFITAYGMQYTGSSFILDSQSFDIEGGDLSQFLQSPRFAEEMAYNARVLGDWKGSSTPGWLASQGIDPYPAAEPTQSGVGVVINGQPYPEVIKPLPKTQPVTAICGDFYCKQGSTIIPNMSAPVGKLMSLQQDIGTEVAVVTVVAAPAIVGTSVPQALFSREFGLLNRNPYLRIGWGWSGKKLTGREVFRIGFGSGKGHPHWDWW
jgi:RHS repeat-associated protein